MAYPGPHYAPEVAYKWYYVYYAQEGYIVTFNPDPEPVVGDFRNESMVSELVDTLGVDKIRKLDAEAARWLKARKLM